MPIDHVMIKVGSWEEAKRYYSAAIKPLGYEPVADWGTGEQAVCRSCIFLVLALYSRSSQ